MAKFGPWPLGMNNIVRDDEMPRNRNGVIVAARNIVNADVDAVGQLRRRGGYSKVLSGAGLRGAYSCPLGTFVIQNATLCRLESDNSLTQLFAGVFGDYVSYDYFNGAVYFSDGLITRRITSSGVEPWGQDVPLPPVLHPVPGLLPPGTYLAAITTVDASGRESGASEVVSIALNTSSGIRFSNLPADKTARLYLSTTNGRTLHAVVDSIGSGDYPVLAEGYDGGKPLDTVGLSAPPPGRIIRHHRGRIYVVDGDVVWYTEAYSTDLVDRGAGFFQFPAPVTVFEPVDAGIWVVSETTEFFAGTGPEDFQPSQRLNYGAVFGTSQVLPRTREVIWYSSRGLVFGSADGQIKNLQEENVAAGSGSSGATLVREQNGLRQCLVSVKDPTVSPLVADSFLEMEVIRKAAT